MQCWAFERWMRKRFFRIFKMKLRDISCSFLFLLYSSFYYPYFFSHHFHDTVFRTALDRRPSRPFSIRSVYLCAAVRLVLIHSVALSSTAVALQGNSGSPNHIALSLLSQCCVMNVVQTRGTSPDWCRRCAPLSHRCNSAARFDDLVRHQSFRLLREAAVDCTGPCRSRQNILFTIGTDRETREGEKGETRKIYIFLVAFSSDKRSTNKFFRCINGARTRSHNRWLTMGGMRQATSATSNAMGERRRQNWK